MPCDKNAHFNLDQYMQIGQRIAGMINTRAPFDPERYQGFVKEIHALVGEARLRKEEHAQQQHPEAASVPAEWERHSADTAGDYLRRYSTAMAVAPRAWAGWTEDEEETLLESYYAGETLQSIAHRHQRKLNAIRSRLQHLGLPPDRSRLNDLPDRRAQWVSAAADVDEVVS